ncbi:helix-turn-helix transcriptional regulator [Planctomycetota bacterium]
MPQISKIERVLNLVSYLLKERRPVPWREIAGKVVGYDDKTDQKSLERRFERDKAALKDLGIPIRFYPPGVYESEGYMISREHCFLDTLELLPHEVALLNLLSELGVRTGERSPELLSALQKLRFDETPSYVQQPAGAGDEDGGGVSAWRRSVLRLDKVASVRSDPNVERITQAVLTSTAASFTYYAISSGETRQRTVDPYGLGFARGNWYLVGRDHLRDAIRQFKVARICGTVQLGGGPRSFAVPEDFNVHEHMERAPWAASTDDGARPLEVAVLLDRDIAWFVDGPVASTSLEEREDGSVVHRLQVTDEAAFVSWLLRHAQHVRVLEPASLRKRFRDAVRRLIERHAASAKV